MSAKQPSRILKPPPSLAMLSRAPKLVVGFISLLLFSTASANGQAAASITSPHPTNSPLKHSCLDYGEYLHWAGSQEAVCGYPGGMVVRGNYAYMADGRLLVVDLADSWQPEIVGSTGPAWVGPALEGNYAYALWNPISQTHELNSFDISDPTAPYKVSVTGPLFLQARSVAASGDYAYVASYHGLAVIDASEPASLAEVANLALPYYASRHVRVANQYAYVANGAAGLQIVDVSDPLAPEIAGAFDTSGEAYWVVVVGNLAYVADGASGLQVIDVSDPTVPAFLGMVDTPDLAISLAVQGNYVYLADFEMGIQVIDVANPTQPQITGALRTVGDHYIVAVHGGTAYAQVEFPGGLSAGEYSFLEGSLQIIDITNPALAPILGSVDTPDDALDVSVAGDIAYVADYRADLQVVDVANPSLPTIITSVATGGTVRGVAAVGNYVYLADGLWGLEVVDVTDPAAPAIVGSVVTPGSAYGVTVSGNIAYVADYYAGMQVIDVTEPTAPAIVGAVDLPEGTYEVAVAGDFAYVANGTHGLQIIDVTAANSPTLLSTVSMPDNYFEVLSVAVVNGWAFVAAYWSGFHVVDVSQPASPAVVTSLVDLGMNRHVTVSGDFAYLVVEDSGVHLLDISDPIQPVLMGTVEAGGLAKAVTVSESHVYAASGGAGLQIFWRQCDQPVPVFLSSFTAQAEAGGVDLHWTVAAPSAPADFRLTGRMSDTVWVVPHRLAGPSHYAARDGCDQLVRGGEVHYELYYRSEGREWVLLDTTTVTLSLPPSATRLVGVHPNPFNPHTTIDFAVDRPQRVTVSVFDMGGRWISTLVDRRFEAGSHSLVWDGKDATGRVVSSGTYLVRLVAENVTKSQKIMLLR